jgi:hypothetical protein
MLIRINFQPLWRQYPDFKILVLEIDDTVILEGPDKGETFRIAGLVSMSDLGISCAILAEDDGIVLFITRDPWIKRVKTRLLDIKSCLLVPPGAIGQQLHIPPRATPAGTACPKDKRHKNQYGPPSKHQAHHFQLEGAETLRFKTRKTATYC